MENQKKSLLAIHVAVLLFGFAGLFGKLVSLPAILIALGRVFFSSIFLFIIFKLRKSKINLNCRKDYLLAVAAGAVLAFHWTVFLQSIQVSTVAIGTLTFSTFPLFVTFLEPYLFHEKLKISDVICAVIMLVGVIFIVPEFELGNQMTQGVILGMLGSLSYAVLSLLNRTLTVHYSGSTVAFYEQGSATIFLLPSLFLIRPEVCAKDWLGMLILGVVCTAFAYTMYIDGLKYVKAQTAGIISGLESVYSIVAAFLLLHEVPGVKELAGGVVILGVAFYSTLASARKAKGKESL